METVGRKLVRRNILPDIAGRRALDQQGSDEVAELPMRAGDVLTAMQECRELGAVVLVGHQRIGLEHSLEPLVSAAGLVADFGEMFEVGGDLTFVPCDQNSLDV